MPSYYINDSMISSQLDYMKLKTVKFEWNDKFS